VFFEDRSSSLIGQDFSLSPETKNGRNVKKETTNSHESLWLKHRAVAPGSLERNASMNSFSVFMIKATFMERSSANRSAMPYHFGAS
jgi:hypothetical protein